MGRGALPLACLRCPRATPMLSACCEHPDWRSAVRCESLSPVPEAGIYDLDAGAVEVGHVAGCQRGALGTAAGRDQRVEAGDRFPGLLAAAGDDRVMFRGCGIDRQDLVGEGREDLV